MWDGPATTAGATAAIVDVCSRVTHIVWAMMRRSSNLNLATFSMTDGIS